MNEITQNVLVTGVSSGIGAATAKALLGRGARVFGTVRNPDDARELKALGGERFVPVVLDLAKPETIEPGVAMVANQVGKAGLQCLINNAGVARPGPIVEQPMPEIRAMFEINFFGLVQLTRACLPLLGLGLTTGPGKDPRARPGKIINVSSGAGKIGIPFLAAYVASKHALEGFSHSLRRELLPWKIPVVVVGPGNVKTPIWDKGGDTRAYEGGLFGAVYANFLRVMREGEKKGMAAEEVAELLARISVLAKPKTRYEPVAQKFANWTLPRLLPDKALDGMFFKLLGMQE